MWIGSFRVLNYKSFEDSDTHQLSRRMNVVVGQNNAGKTALLKAIGDIRAISAPHRDSRLRREQSFNPESRVEMEAHCTPQELIDHILRENTQVHIPAGRNFGSALDTARHILELNEIVSKAVRISSGGQLSVDRTKYPSIALDADAANPRSIVLHPDQTRTQLAEARSANNANDNIGTFMLSTTLSKTYYFDAHRIISGRWNHGTNTQLASNAENLAEVLINLQHSPSAYKRYLDQVRRVLPLVKHVSVKPINNSQNEIFIWNTDEETERDDLAIPLAECGTGIGQVLAMLYVVMHSRGDVLVIDEPNSFLHPRAVRELVSIFRADKEHQYIISTHSPDVIVASRPEKLFVLTIQDETTKIKELDQTDISSARQVLEEVGSRLSDVFGADKVIWVEGPTEVECIPLLLAHVNKRLSTGVSIVPLRSTGDLEGKHANAIADIYRNISSANSLLPENAAILMDGDKRGNPRIEAIEKAFGIRVSFLKRRTYENYLLSPKAICACLNMLPSFEETPVSEDRVSELLQELGVGAEYGSSKHEVFSDAWTCSVDAPNLLDDLFQEISDAKEIFRKTTHSAELTRWLLKNDPAFLNPITQELQDVVGPAAVSS